MQPQAHDRVAITINDSGGLLHVVGRCSSCRIVRERFMVDTERSRSVALIIIADAMTEAGCTHVEPFESPRQVSPARTTRRESGSRPKVTV